MKREKKKGTGKIEKKERCWENEKEMKRKKRKEWEKKQVKRKKN